LPPRPAGRWPWARCAARARERGQAVHKCRCSHVCRAGALQCTCCDASRVCSQRSVCAVLRQSNQDNSAGLTTLHRRGGGCAQTHAGLAGAALSGGARRAALASASCLTAALAAALSLTKIRGSGGGGGACAAAPRSAAPPLGGRQGPGASAGPRAFFRFLAPSLRTWTGCDLSICAAWARRQHAHGAPKMARGTGARVQRLEESAAPSRGMAYRSAWPCHSLGGT